MIHGMQKVVFITGASSGLGKGLAIKFAQKGYAVALAARRFSEVEVLANTLSEQGCRVLPLHCDVTEKQSVQEAVQQCVAQFGPVDIMVANAGISLATLGKKMCSDTFKQIWDTNVLGPVYCYEAVTPSMIQRRAGQLVSISSLAAFRGLPEAGGYSSSKAALTSLTESLRIDLKPFNIKVSLIQPGWIQTPMTDKNRYKMPFLVSYEKGVDAIYKAIHKQVAVYSFPWPLAMIVRVGRLLPAWLYDSCIGGRKNRKSD